MAKNKMKYFAYCLLVIACLATACHRKTTAAKTERAKSTKLEPLLSEKEAAGEASVAKPAPAPAVSKPVIIVDARGNFAVSAKSLPADASHEILDPANARAYTPAQTKTLAYRFGKVPPRILYVPAALQKKSGKGTYYVLDKKFWYWKKNNGYFYIDENYFQ